MDRINEMARASVKALDALVNALTDSGHQWTNEQHALYQKAVRLCDEYLLSGTRHEES